MASLGEQIKIDHAEMNHAFSVVLPQTPANTRIASALPVETSQRPISMFAPYCESWLRAHPTARMCGQQMYNRFTGWDALCEQFVRWAISLKRVFKADVGTAASRETRLSEHQVFSLANQIDRAFAHGLEDARSGKVKRNPYPAGTERHREYDAAYEYDEWAERNMW